MNVTQRRSSGGFKRATGALPGDKTEYTYDLPGNQTLLKRNSGRQTRRDYWPNGMLARRVVKKSDTDPTERSYGYAYSPTRALVALDDHDLDHLRSVSRDDLDRVKFVDETWDSGKDSSFDYDADCNLIGLFVETNASPTSQAGKGSCYRIDSTGLQRRMVTSVDGQSDTRRIDTSYWPSGQKLRRDKDPGAVEKWTYDPHSRLTRRIHGTATDQIYTYDEHGNRTNDEKGAYTYNAHDQMVRCDVEVFLDKHEAARLAAALQEASSSAG